MKRELLLLAIVVTSCSATGYQTYGISTDKDGNVREYLADKSKNDLPISACAPRLDARFPCRMIFVEEQNRIEDHIAELEERLKACEQSSGN